MAPRISGSWLAPGSAPATGWRAQAACSGHDPALWDLADDGSVANREAEKICAGCPVKAACYDDAVQRRDHGVIRGECRFIAPGKTTVQLTCRRCNRIFHRQKVGTNPAKYCGDTCRRGGAAISAAMAAHRAECGTHDGWQAHRARHEHACRPCITARVEHLVAAHRARMGAA